MGDSFDVVVGEAVERWTHAGKEVTARLTRLPGEVQVHLVWRGESEMLYARYQPHVPIAGWQQALGVAARLKAALGENCTNDWKCPVCLEAQNG